MSIEISNNSTMNVDISRDNKRENYMYTGLVLIQLPQALMRLQLKLSPVFAQFPKCAKQLVGW